MTTDLAPIVHGDLVPGRYRLGAAVRVRALRDELAAAGWTTRIVDGAAMTDRDSMFEEFAAGCDFPHGSGRNWDAFVDCLRDLSWESGAGAVVLWQHSGRFAETDPAVWERAGRVIDAAIEARVAVDLPPLFVLYPMAAGGLMAADGLSDGGGPMLRPVR